jgi:DNA-binding transcriptional LysR family regulator
MTPFARHQTGYFLTDAGSEVLRHAETVEESILATGLDKAPAGTVRLSTSESLATDLIIPAMPGTARRQMNAHGGGALVAGSAHRLECAYFGQEAALPVNKAPRWERLRSGSDIGTGFNRLKTEMATNDGL